LGGRTGQASAFGPQSESETAFPKR
jgi:hypothetical protein